VAYDWSDGYHATRPPRTPRARFSYPLRHWSRFGTGLPPVVVERKPLQEPYQGSDKAKKLARRK
jgi:hypothetical protein